MTRPASNKDCIHDAPEKIQQEASETKKMTVVDAGSSTVVMRAVVAPAAPREAAPVAQPESDELAGDELSVAEEFDLDDFCPKCSAELSDPVHVGWCLRCGYCRYLENARPIQPMQVQLDPETRSAIELLLELSRVLKKKSVGQPALKRYCDVLEGLSKFLRRKARTGGDISSYRDLLQSISKRFVKGQTDVDVAGAGWDDLFQTMSQKYKAEMVAGQAFNRPGLDRLNLPIPGLDFIPEWLAVLVCGLFICAVGSFMAGFNLRGAPEARYLWCVSEIGLGVLMICMAQVSAFLEIVPYGLRRKKLLMFVAFDLWWAVWQRLPGTYWTVWLLGWGLGLSVSGGLILLAMELDY
jgi:hypothetical protein